MCVVGVWRHVLDCNREGKLLCVNNMAKSLAFRHIGDTHNTVIIKCISWLIKVIDNNDALWKPEISRIKFS
jgi:hypothetical protein